MQQYEIRVLSSGYPILIIEAMYLNDHAAVRAAKSLARDRPFEVWRDLDCIYAPPRQPYGQYRSPPTPRSDAELLQGAREVVKDSGRNALSYGDA